MKALLITALSAAALAVPSAALAEVDPGFGVPEVDPGFGVREPIERRTVHPLARILFFPILPFVELQSQLSPEKASCWNDRAGEVVGCGLVEEIEEAQANRPTPYTF